MSICLWSGLWVLRLFLVETAVRSLPGPWVSIASVSRAVLVCAGVVVCIELANLPSFLFVVGGWVILLCAMRPMVVVCLVLARDLLLLQFACHCMVPCLFPVLVGWCYRAVCLLV